MLTFVIRVKWGAIPLKNKELMVYLHERNQNVYESERIKFVINGQDL